MRRRDDATENQVRAADPAASTWLAANAGSGKTRVLTDRVARLLLRGQNPQRILCLTYTKAAASEMQNRLFKRLGRWAMLDDDALRDELEELGAEGPITAEALREARTLFAAAIETPGGLKIQTIHSFCAGLLRRFPLEAGVSPQFTEIEDRAAALLRAEIVDDMAAGSQAALVEDVARYLGGSDLSDLTRAIAGARDGFDTPRDLPGLLTALGQAPDLTEAAIEALTFRDDDAALIARLIPVLMAGGKTDAKHAATLAGIGPLNISALPVLEGMLLFGSGAERNAPFSPRFGLLPSKGARAPADLHAAVDDLMQRVADARPLRLALAAAQRALALHRFAHAFLSDYAERKHLRGWLDFDDLIGKARRLLLDADVAQWVLFRLDGGIDHILVDEAQDTSPAQWDVIERLSQEFTAGLGARDTARSIFVVGDKKQSIYSFQGADPGGFDRMRDHFRERLTATGQALRSLSLDHSFRSAPTILSLVDAMFEAEAQAGFDDAAHVAFHAEMPGRVDLWPVIPPEDDPEDLPWHSPVDRVSPTHPGVRLANAVAAQIKAMIDDKVVIPHLKEGPRPVRAGDILILVQKRSGVFPEIIRACKALDLPIAGADRLRVGAEMAVKDLRALLSFLATPEDDLSLAVALRSPLLGWDEQALFDLAHRRAPRAFLWQALRDRRSEFPETFAVLEDLRDAADYLRPYDLIERVLIRHEGRRRLLARLGREAEDGIDALLSQALAYERTEVPGLTGFLVWMETDDLEIKRQVDAQGDMIRVMTVHGAKGLEAPVVFLPDTALHRDGQPGVVQLMGGTPLWRLPEDERPEPMARAQAEEAARSRAERLRLLYVALTRAQSWLVVAAAGKLDTKDGDTWYQRIEAGLNRQGAVPLATPLGEGLRLQGGDWDGMTGHHAAPVKADAVVLPEMFDRPAPPAEPAPETLSPSDLGGAKAMPGDAGLDEEEAKARGTRLHLLLEHLPTLPQAEWAECARNLVDCDDPAKADALLAEARAVLTAPDLAHVFAPDALAEVPITAQVGGRRLHGTIDRLIIGADHVLAVDYKSNATVPDTATACPEGLLRQMGAYLAMLEQVFPRHRIDLAILWTRTASLMPLPQDVVRSALARAPNLDLSAGPS